MISRGLAKRPLFESRDDARFFLARLIRQVRLGRLEIHACCLLTAHLHLPSTEHFTAAAYRRACGAASDRALEAELASHHPWIIEVGWSTWRGAELAWHGLLHDFCGCTWKAIACHESCLPSRSQRLTQRHRRWLADDPSHAARAASVVHAATSPRIGLTGYSLAELDPSCDETTHAVLRDR